MVCCLIMKSPIAVFSNNVSDPSELGNILLFKGAGLAAIEEVVKACPILTLQSDEVLVEAGQSSQALYLIVQGRLRLHEESPDSEPVGTVEKGEALRDLSMIHGGPSTFFVVADMETRLLLLDEDSILRLIDESHDFARNFSCFLMEQCRNSDVVAQEKARYSKKYQRLSSVDELTGLHNRRWLDEMLTRQILRCTSNDQCMSAAMIAIDKLDEFYEEYGEVSTRQAIYTVGTTLSDKLRPTDMIGRFDKNRFLVVLPNTDLSGAEKTGLRLRQAISGKKVIIPRECILPAVKISVGILQLSSFIATAKLLSNIEQALQRAIARGGDWVSE